MPRMMPGMSVPTAIDLAALLVRAPSVSGSEGPAAEVLLAAMRDAGFDDVHLDDVGNAVGIIDMGPGPTVLLTGHIDTVSPGDESEWEHPPLGGDVVGGRLWGRGSVDMKSAVACMVQAAAEAKRAGFRGRLIVAGAVLEETNGFGSMHLARTLDYDVAVLGEPSKLQLKLGHKGRVEVAATFTGSIAHAAQPELGASALEAAARFVTAMGGIELPSSDVLGSATATPTRLVTYPRSTTNVVPGRAEMILDCRTITGQSAEDVIALLSGLAQNGDVEFSVPSSTVVEPDGRSRESPHVAPAYLLPPGSETASTARRTLKGVLADAGLPFAEGVWWFCTDAPHLSAGGRPVVGFGPGEEELAHTTRESVSVTDLEVATRAYRELALAYLGGAK